MGLAVYHTEKGKASSGGIGNHIDRKEGAEHTYPHADPNLKDLNKHFKITEHCNKPLHKAINDRIEEGYKGKTAIRKDAVKYQTHVLTGSHDDMKKIFSNEKTANEWIKANYKFICDEYGKENILRFSLHMDEKTPHIHAVTVPLTADGRLSAKEVMGNKKVFQERQDRYAEVVKPFNLERGVRGSQATHENAKEYYTRINEAMKIKEEPSKVLNKDFLGRFKVSDIESIQNDNTSLKMALKEALRVKDKYLNQNKSQWKEIDKLQSKVQTTKLEHKQTIDNLILKPKELEDLQKKKVEQIVNTLEKQVQSAGKLYPKGTEFNKEIFQELRTKNLVKITPQEVILINNLNPKAVIMIAKAFEKGVNEITNISPRRDRGYGY